MSGFFNIYKGHGGIVNLSPDNLYVHTGTIQDLGSKIKDYVNNAKKMFKKSPDIIFFILSDNSVDVYNIIKKSMDCRFGIASQCMQAQHILKSSPQYQSNISMKVNAKLGGATCQARGPKSALIVAPFYNLKERVMVVGVDVTHAAPGSKVNSIVYIVTSKDATLTYYMGAVEVNGYRQDIIYQE
jgi:eukaryotic translation initiation factor 2C